MVINLIDRDSLVNVCKNTITNVNSHDEYSENEKGFIKAANEYMIQVLEGLNPVVVDIPEAK